MSSRYREEGGAAMATTTYLSLEYESRYGTARGYLDVGIA